MARGDEDQTSKYLVKREGVGIAGTIAEGNGGMRRYNRSHGCGDETGEKRTITRVELGGNSQNSRSKGQLYVPANYPVTGHCLVRMRPISFFPESRLSFLSMRFGRSLFFHDINAAALLPRQLRLDFQAQHSQSVVVAVLNSQPSELV